MKARNTIIVNSDQIVRLNAIIHNQREKLRTLNEDKSILKKERVELLKKIDELEKENWCLKEFLKVLEKFDTVYRSEIKNVIKELDK